MECKTKSLHGTRLHQPAPPPCHVSLNPPPPPCHHHHYLGRWRPSLHRYLLSSIHLSSKINSWASCQELLFHWTLGNCGWKLLLEIMHGLLETLTPEEQLCRREQGLKTHLYCKKNTSSAMKIRTKTHINIHFTN